jgi:hypothetical protein
VLSFSAKRGGIGASAFRENVLGKFMKRKLLITKVTFT